MFSYSQDQEAQQLNATVQAFLKKRGYHSLFVSREDAAEACEVDQFIPLTMQPSAQPKVSKAGESYRTLSIDGQGTGGVVPDTAPDTRLSIWAKNARHLSPDSKGDGSKRVQRPTFADLNAKRRS